MKKKRKQCNHCPRITLLPYSYEWTRIFCEYNVIKQKNDFLKIQRTKINFINRLNYAEHKIISICIDVYKICEGDDYNKIHEILSKLKNRKIKINRIFTEKRKNMCEHPVFEQKYYSTTGKGVYEIGQDSIRLMNSLAWNDRYYENINYLDLMASVLTCPNELF